MQKNQCFFSVNFRCPQNKQDEVSLRMCAGDQGFCLIKDGDDVKLDRNHSYYYQVQAQLHIVGAEYCDFVVWNKNDIFVERILPDNELWDNAIPKVQEFFTHCVLPELLGQQITKWKTLVLEVVKYLNML